MKKLPLIDDFFLLEVEKAPFFDFLSQAPKDFFPPRNRLRVPDLLSNVERSQLQKLQHSDRNNYAQHWWIRRGDETIGWSYGHQVDSESYYMVNTGIYPAFQGRGIYKSLLRVILSELKEVGFQVVLSRHAPTNNRVLIPKLKAGFLITGMRVSDMFGPQIELSYFFNEKRRRVVEYRLGGLLDQELQKYITQT